jgi:hypothetical protein
MSLTKDLRASRGLIDMKAQEYNSFPDESPFLSR